MTHYAEAITSIVPGSNKALQEALQALEDRPAITPAANGSSTCRAYRTHLEGVVGGIQFTGTDRNPMALHTNGDHWLLGTPEGRSLAELAARVYEPHADDEGVLDRMIDRLGLRDMQKPCNGLLDQLLVLGKLTRIRVGLIAETRGAPASIGRLLA